MIRPRKRSGAASWTVAFELADHAANPAPTTNSSRPARNSFRVCADARPLELLDGEELARAHQEEACEHRDKRDRVDEETDADAGDEQKPGDRRPEDPRRVEEARVERDRIRQRVAADHPVRQL